MIQLTSADQSERKLLNFLIPKHLTSFHCKFQKLKISKFFDFKRSIFEGLTKISDSDGNSKDWTRKGRKFVQWLEWTGFQNLSWLQLLLKMIFLQLKKKLPKFSKRFSLLNNSFQSNDSILRPIDLLSGLRRTVLVRLPTFLTRSLFILCSISSSSTERVHKISFRHSFEIKICKLYLNKVKNIMKII